MYSLSALYTLQYVPIVTHPCKLFIQKKKKKKKKTRTLVWVKIPKLCHKKPRYLSFLLGKGGNPYVSKLYIKKLSKSALSALPLACKNILIQTMCGRRMPKLTKISSLFRKFHTFPVTEGYAI